MAAARDDAPTVLTPGLKATAALGLIALTGLIVALTWREYQRQRVYRVVTVSARSA
ncbi:MAG TPA: hypothetical protein VFM91_00585 [Propionibacteriaceae bacterium]|nr:hypothetical protein [Propionibacteriaceae bacterium]